MYKKKKIIIRFLTLCYILLSVIELIKYFFFNSNIFGLVYLIITIFNIFLLIPICNNYKKYFSSVRISKLIIIVINGIFISFFLNRITSSIMNYSDSSLDYINSIYWIKNILKPILYFLIIIFTIFEFRLEKVVKKSNNNVKRKS